MIAVEQLMSEKPYIHSVYIGQPKTISDEQGTWRSSIGRDRVDGPVEVEMRGFVGDRATQPYHGTPELAVCSHLLGHYRFWNEQYGMSLGPGNVGENLALENVTEDEICIGDVYGMGTAVVQVSAPRIPCHNQARRIGRADWVKLTLQELRLGLYMRVLEPGVLQAGDKLHLVERLNPQATMTAFNRCYYQEFDAELARQCTTMPGLMTWWQERFAKKLASVT
jgi:MOSC domain-containing protein YiiM